VRRRRPGHGNRHRADVVTTPADRAIDIDLQQAASFVTDPDLEIVSTDREVEAQWATFFDWLVGLDEDEQREYLRSWKPSIRSGCTSWQWRLALPWSRMSPGGCRGRSPADPDSMIECSRLARLAGVSLPPVHTRS
jgi:hypothetical protein